MTTMPNTTPGSTATVTHTQPSYVAAATDPLSSRDAAGQPTFKRRWVPLTACMFYLLCGSTVLLQFQNVVASNRTVPDLKHT